MSEDYVPERNAQTWPKCGKCGIIWRQSGNRTGHCSRCHRTFDGIYAFDRHQSTQQGVLTCIDPLTLDGFAVRFGAGPFDKNHVYYRIESSESFEEAKKRFA